MEKISYEELVKINPKLKIINDMVKHIIDDVYSVIPDSAYENFINNLKTLDLVFDEHKSHEEAYDFSDAYDGFNPRYDPVSNRIVLCKPLLKQYYRESVKTGNPIDYYYSSIYSDLLHEFFHVASSKYGEDYKSGFCINQIDNMGITEGYTDYYSNSLFNDKYKYSGSGYKEFINYAKLLRLFVGKDLMDDCYFNNKGIQPIIDKLESYGISNNILNNLFFTLDVYFSKEYKEPVENDKIGYINHYFNIILKAVITNPENKEHVRDILQEYESTIVTGSVLESYNRDPKLFLLLNESISEFEEIKELGRKVIHDESR